MKRGLAFGLVLLLGVGALLLSERRKAEAPLSPDPILYLIADAERDLSRVPAQATRLSDAEEIRIGDELAKDYSNDGTTLSEQDRAMQAYVNEVGARVVVHTRRQLPYRFHYLPGRYLVNAFSLPGGHVYIGAGLIALMNSEDELAAVLGHEVEHVEHYHCVERYQVAARTHGVVGGLVQLPLEIFQAGYSKDQELEADREGTRLAVEAGYSPLGAIQVFEAYQRLRQQEDAQARSPQEEAARMTVETLSGYFRSHPLEADRIEQIRRLIASEHWEDRTNERPLRVRYQPPPESPGN